MMMMHLHTGEEVTLTQDDCGYEMIIAVEEPGTLALTVDDLVRWRDMLNAVLLRGQARRRVPWSLMRQCQVVTISFKE